MLRIEPRHWLHLLFIVAAATGLGFGTAYRLNGGRDAPEADLLLGTAIGAVVGVILGIGLYVYYGRHDSRRLAVAQQLPHAYVVQAQVDKAFRSALARIDAAATVPARIVTIAFDTVGISFWTGTAVPTRVAFIPAAQILSISAGRATPAASSRSVPVGRMMVAARVGEDQVDLLFAVERPTIFTAGSVLSETQIVDAARLASAAVMGARTPSTRSASLTTASYIDHRTPGLTAWTAARDLRVSGAVLIVGTALSVAGVLLSIRSGGSGVIWVFIGVMLAVVYVALPLLGRRLKRASDRERAAGYTTLNHSDFDLRQLHPRTGTLLREAGTQPLTKDEFARALASR